MKRVFNPYVYLLVLSLLGIAGIFAMRGVESARTVSRDGVAMDTLVSISVSAPKSARSTSTGRCP